MGEVEKVLMDPKHPYTALLRESIPEPDPERRWSEKMELAESEREEYLRIGLQVRGALSARHGEVPAGDAAGHRRGRGSRQVFPVRLSTRPDGPGSGDSRV